MSETILEQGCLIWGRDGIEQNTVEQAARTAQLPFVEHPVALMPDAHVGIGATVGSVIATHGAIVPAAVGVDIGCGMIAAPVMIGAEHLPDDLSELHSKIEAVVPSGVGKGHGGNVGWAWSETQERMDLFKLENQPAMLQTNNKLWRRTTEQFGTLGSGNHFIEVCLDQDEQVWVVLHSGSRGVGNEIAKRHIDGAKKLMKKYFIDLEDKDLAYFAEHTPEFDEYIHDMLWAQEYAAANRAAMMTNVLKELEAVVGIDFWYGPYINCHHNYTEREQHHGKSLWVTRKGAIRAREGDKGIIPGSMATGTYIVQGLGNVASYTSASHGAGRRMSRTRARNELDHDGLVEAMAGKAWNNNPKALIDEDPRAYKPIEDVMSAQADLVEVTHTLSQVLNYKGV